MKERFDRRFAWLGLLVFAAAKTTSGAKSNGLRQSPIAGYGVTNQDNDSTAVIVDAVGLTLILTNPDMCSTMTRVPRQFGGNAAIITWSAR